MAADIAAKCRFNGPQEVTPMFLIGQYDSPFVRRTAIALKL